MSDHGGPGPDATRDVTRRPAGRRDSPTGAPPSNRRRRWLPAAVAAVITLVLLLLLDRAAEALTAHELAVKIQRAQHLSARPHVTVRGFPFLTQVLAGKYTEIDVSSDIPVTNRGVTLSSVSVRLHGVHVGLIDALHGNVTAVPVDNGTGTALLSYRDLDTILASSTAGLGAASLGAAITLTPAAPPSTAVGHHAHRRCGRHQRHAHHHVDAGRAVGAPRARPHPGRYRDRRSAPAARVPLQRPSRRRHPRRRWTPPHRRRRELRLPHPLTSPVSRRSTTSTPRDLGRSSRPGMRSTAMVLPMTWYWEQRAALSPIETRPGASGGHLGGTSAIPCPAVGSTSDRPSNRSAGCSCGTTIGPYCDCSAGRVVAGKWVCLGCGVGDDGTAARHGTAADQATMSVAAVVAGGAGGQRPTRPALPASCMFVAGSRRPARDALLWTRPVTTRGGGRWEPILGTCTTRPFRLTSVGCWAGWCPSG